LSSSDDKPKTTAGAGARKARTPAKVPTREQEMGSALRSVYQNAVDEEVPDEMMDLLGKLG
jgi:hypothetical protein